MRYAFGSTENNYSDLIKEDYRESQPWLSDMSEAYGIFDNGLLVSSGAYHVYKLKIHDKIFDMGGIWGIVTSPHYRNRGYIGAILHEMLEDMNERHIPISVLYPFKYAFYEQFGWKLANHAYFYRIELEHIITRPITTRTVREVEIKKREVPEDIKTAYRHFFERYNFIVDRTDRNWRDTIDFKKPGFWFVCYDENDIPCGYVGLRFLEKDEWWWLNLDEQERTIHLRDIVWNDRETKQALFNFLKSHRGHRKFAMFSVSDHFYPSTVICNYRDIIRVRPGGMARIVNVKDLFEAFDYPIETDFVLRVIDDFFSPNNKSFRFKVTKGKATLEETSDSPDVTISIGSLSQMATGYRNASQLWESWEIDCMKDMLPILDKLFPSRINFLRDFF